MRKNHTVSGAIGGQKQKGRPGVPSLFNGGALRGPFGQEAAGIVDTSVAQNLLKPLSGHLFFSRSRICVVKIPHIALYTPRQFYRGKTQRGERKVLQIAIL